MGLLYLYLYLLPVDEFWTLSCTWQHLWNKKSRNTFRWVWLFCHIPKCFHIAGPLSSPSLLTLRLLMSYIYICIYIYIYRVSQEECARLREGVPYVKVYRYNPKHLCPKLNGYGDNGRRKVWSSGGSTHSTCQLTSLIDVCSWVWCPITESQLTLALYQNAQSAMLRQCLPYMCHV